MPPILSRTRPDLPLSRLALVAGVVGPAIFVGSFLIQGALRPGYDPLCHPISSLALGDPAGWVQSATFVLTGGLFTAYAWGLWRCRLGRWTPILVAAVGVGLIGAGIFAADPINGYPPGSPEPVVPTPEGRRHDLFSTPVFTALPAAGLVFAARMAKAGERRWAAYSRVTAAVFWACFVLSAVGFNGVAPLVATGGLWQRLSIVVGFGWLVTVALWLWRRDRARPRIGSVIIRDATEADAAACAAIYAPYVLQTSVSFEIEPPTPDQMAARIAGARERHAWSVLELDGRVAGYAYGHPFAERAAYRWSCAVSIYLERERHRAGGGRMLYEALLTRLADRGYRRAMAGMTLPNDASAGFHRALGFEPVGVYRRVGWKNGAWHDVAWVQKTIRDADDPPAEPH